MFQEKFLKGTFLRKLAQGLVLCLCIFGIPTELFAGPAMPEGKKTIFLKQADGGEFRLGTVTFTPTQKGTSFAVKLDESLFSDHFLNMYPFKCLEHVKQMLCHLPYPYETKGLITPGDFGDLEYALLFIKKKPTAYGINFWNGVYYKMILTPKGQLKGEVYETDMNELASPPDKKYDRLIPQNALTKGEPGNHLYPQIFVK